MCLAGAIQAECLRSVFSVSHHDPVEFLYSDQKLQGRVDSMLILGGCRRLLHALNPTLQVLAVSSLHPIYDFFTCIIWHLGASYVYVAGHVHRKSAKPRSSLFQPSWGN